jgi:phosphoribosylformylglycinamidine cyclo-ligase
MSDEGTQGGGSNDPERGLRYRDAGVDIERQDRALARIKGLVASTRIPGVLSEVGSFGGLFALDLAAWREPVLVASCDGVGTKLRVAFLTGVHDTVGRDLVNHCVNDILVQGARPLFFLDYVAAGRLEPAVVTAVVEGVARGCREAGCALLGGELAEMPEFYADGEYDVAGFIVGAVERARLIDGRAIRPGDRLFGLPSAGLHTNGYSLARKVFFEVAGLGPDERVAELGDTVGRLLLAEHRSYLPALAGLVDAGRLSGLAHITGGGLVDNLPRILPEGTAALIRRGSWPVPRLFGWLARVGRISAAEMERTFNMGIGMVAVAAADQADAVTAHLEERGEACYPIGEIVAGDRRVIHG